MNKETTDSKLMDVTEASLTLLRPVRKLSSCLETALVTHLSPLVTSSRTCDGVDSSLSSGTANTSEN